MLTDLEREYVMMALNSLDTWLVLLPTVVQRRVRLATSVMDTHGLATTKEIRAELGEVWVMARRTKRIVEKYGEGVRCVSAVEFEAVQRQAIEQRFPAVQFSAAAMAIEADWLTRATEAAKSMRAAIQAASQ